MIEKLKESRLGGGREAYADALKFLGIILVVRGHVELFGLGIGVEDSYDYKSILFMYSFTMPLFFFISGYYAYKVNIPTCEMNKKLLNKLLYLVLPAVTFYIYYNATNGSSIFGFIANGFGRYWFTITLFQCFLIYYIVRIFTSNRRWLTFVLLFLSITGIVYLSLFSKYEIPLLDLNHLTKYFQYFTFGIIAKMYNEKYVRLISNQAIISLTTIGFFLILLALFECHMPSILHHGLRDIVLRYLGTFMVVSLFYNNKEKFEKATPINNIIILVGRYTLPIYLLQYFFLPDIRCYTAVIEKLDMVTVNIICFLYTAFIIFLCMMFILLLSNSRIISKYILGHRI